MEDAQRVMVVSESEIHMTEDMSESEAIEAMRCILAGIIKDHNSMQITGVFRITLQESVTLRK